MCCECRNTSMCLAPLRCRNLCVLPQQRFRCSQSGVAIATAAAVAGAAVLSLCIVVCGLRNELKLVQYCALSLNLTGCFQTVRSSIFWTRSRGMELIQSPGDITCQQAIGATHIVRSSSSSAHMQNSFAHSPANKASCMHMFRGMSDPHRSESLSQTPHHMPRSTRVPRATWHGQYQSSSKTGSKTQTNAAVLLPVPWHGANGTPRHPHSIQIQDVCWETLKSWTTLRC